ncbi:hypothetical protein BASA81_004781 [Batrachochytrium salamandrivorans]|nr:hypothetical protein BASA81_004781 [Batrachochytrium salamandrivorans]
MDFNQEVEANVGELKGFVSRVRVVSNVDGKLAVYEIVTLEGNTLLVEFKIGLGYFVQPQQQHYETLQQLLSELSSKYREEFMRQVNARLLRLCLYALVFVLLSYLFAAAYADFRIFSSSPQRKPMTIVNLRDDPNLSSLSSGFREDDIHIVFSTGCNLFQHWQAEVLLFSHIKVGQKGQITRVVSGCDTENVKREHANYLTHPEGLGDDVVSLEELKKSSHPHFHLHVTPSFPGAREFPWINKPMGLAHWLEHANPKESVIVIIDPDQFFMDKLRIDGSRQVGSKSNPILCTLEGGCNNGDTDMVTKGRPVAQQYGLGGGFVHKHNVVGIVGPDSPAAKLTETEAARHYSVGPPMMVHGEDLRKIMPLWVKYMQPVFQGDPGDIQADMYAYSLAAAHNELPHATYDQYMVSSPETDGEAWPYLQHKYNKMICSNPNLGLTFIPTFLHVAQRYDSDLTPFMFHKGHVIANLLTCELPLLVQPPEDLIAQAPKHNKHQMYMLCNAYRLINQAALAWKQKFCIQGNTNKAVMLQKHSQHCSKKDQGNKCWIFARIIDGLN